MLIPPVGIEYRRLEGRRPRLPLVVLAVLAMAVMTPPTQAQTALPEPAAVYEVMQRANDYWLANNGEGNAGWAWGAYYTGNQRAFRLLGEQAYLDRVLAWGEANQWRIGPEGFYHADAHCCGQTYLDLFTLDPQTNRIADITQTMETIVADGTATDDDWWWIDAFYMAAPTLARLGRITGDTNYFHKIALMYDDMKNRRGLFDAASGLWWRDGGYIDDTTSGGNKVFWSRGNGWVIAGLARVLEQMPANAPERVEFEAMFTTMAGALKDLQPLHGSDGMWRSSLHESTDYDGTPETSGTAFFTYAMAWGVRNGLLDPGDYTNTLAAAWHGLTNIALSAGGRVGYVQAVGAGPWYVNPDDTERYGVGAFLLACSELALLHPDGPSVSAWAGPDEEVGDLGGDGHEPVDLDGSATEVYRGAATSFVWSVGALPVATGQTTQAVLPLGTNVVTLQVFHDGGSTWTDQVVKTVVTLPDLEADAGADDMVWDDDQDGEEPVTLDASGTEVFFGTVTSYDWWLGDVCLGTGITAQITLPLGRHMITLKVLSSKGPEYTDEVVMFVAPGVAVSSPFVPESWNPPEDTVDEDFSTRWSADGDGVWIEYDMGRTNTVSAVHVAFFVGDTRHATLSVETSLDASNWTTRLDHVISSGATLDREPFVLPAPTDARYLRVVGHGNDSPSGWNSYTEVALEAAPGMIDTDGDMLPDAWEVARLGHTLGDAATHSDADGVNDGDEYLAGTDPADAASFPVLRLSRPEEGTLQLSFLTRAALGPGYAGLERRYAVEAVSDLDDPYGWSAPGGWGNIRGDNCTKALEFIPAGDLASYRLNVLLRGK